MMQVNGPGQQAFGNGCAIRDRERLGHHAECETRRVCCGGIALNDTYINALPGQAIGGRCPCDSGTDYYRVVSSHPQSQSCQTPLSGASKWEA